MTTLDTRPDNLPVVHMTFDEAPNPQVIDGVYADARDVPARNPHRMSARISALILLGAVGGAVYNAAGTDLERGGSLFALFIAIGVFLTCLIRFNAREKAGDR